MAKASIEVGLTVSFLFDADIDVEDADELDGVVNVAERDDAPEILTTAMKVIADDPRYSYLLTSLQFAVRDLRDRFPDTTFDASLYPVNGLSEPREV